MFDNYFVFKIYEADYVLGVQWLKLGQILTAYTNLSMKFVR